MSTADITSQLWAKCIPCGEVFRYGELPMQIDAVVKAMRETRCPICGAAHDRLTVPMRAEVMAVKPRVAIVGDAD